MKKGFNSVPKQAVNPIEYPDHGFIKEYREIFRRIRELAPYLRDNNQSRWYNSLRDSYIEHRASYPFYPDVNSASGSGNNMSFFNNNIFCIIFL